jgi:hypothetical protein
MMPQQLLTDDELAAYQQHAEAERNWPLAALVAELLDRRAKPYAIVVLAAEQAALLPQLIADRSGPVLVVAPEGTWLQPLPESTWLQPRMSTRTAQLTLETYDPAAPLELRQILWDHGIGA